MEEAVDALGTERRTVFLTQGRLQLAAFARAPQHRYIVRAIDRPAEIDALPDCKLILARGPFSLADEARAHARRADRSAGDQEQRRARDLRQDRGGARARNRSRHRAPAARARSRNAARSRRRHGLDRRSSRKLHKRAASASTARAPSRAMKRVSLEPMMTSVAMSTKPTSASPSVVSDERLVGAPDRAGEGDRRRRRLHGSQQVEGLRDAVRPRLRGRIVERDDEIALRRRAQAALDDRPGLQIVGERDGAEIMAERRAEPRRRRLHRGDARRDLNVELAAIADRLRPPRTPPPPSRTRPDRRPRRRRPRRPPPQASAQGGRGPFRPDCRWRATRWSARNASRST